MRVAASLLLHFWSTAAAQTVSFHPIVPYQLGKKKFTDLAQKVTTVVEASATGVYNGPAWLQTDYDRLTQPTGYLTGLQRFRKEARFFAPYVLSASEVEQDKQYLLRVAYIGKVDSSRTDIATIAYIGAAWEGDSAFRLKNPTDLLTAAWKTATAGTGKFYVPPAGSVNLQQARQSDSFNAEIARKLGLQQLPFEYYLCDNREQAYRLFGYDFHQDMYLTSGIFGLTDAPARRIYAANGSLFYPHEICHLYLPYLYGSGDVSSLVNEGAATYFGGSSGYPIAHHLHVLSGYLQKEKPPTFQSALDKGEILITEETNLSKALAGLMVKIAWERKGLPGLKQLINNPNSRIVEAFGRIMALRDPDTFLLNQARMY